MFSDSTKQPVNRDVETELNHVIQFSNSSEKSVASTSKRHLNSAKDSANSSPELSSRWVKRLKSDYSNSVGNGPHSLEIHNLFSRSLKSKRAKPISMNFFEDEVVFVNEKQLPKTGQGSLGVSMKDMKCWIKRWSRNNSQIILDREGMETTTTMTDGEETTTAVSDKCEARKYPSTAAASTEMTRNAKNKLRSCEFQRRGTSVVWNTGGF